VEGHRLSAPRAHDQAQVRLEAIALLRDRNVERGEECAAEAASDAEDHAPAGQAVEHRHLFGHVDRVADREQERGGRDAQPRRARGDRGEQQQRRRNRAGVADVVIREPEGAVA
jgi:hypothetical protein